MCVDAVEDGGGDGDVDDDGDDNGESDSTTSCFVSDSGNGDGGKADDGPLRFVVKRCNALTVVETLLRDSAMSVTSRPTAAS